MVKNRRNDRQDHKHMFNLFVHKINANESNYKFSIKMTRNFCYSYFVCFTRCSPRQACFGNTVPPLVLKYLLLTYTELGPACFWALLNVINLSIHTRKLRYNAGMWWRSHLLRSRTGDFPGGPMVKTWPSNAEGCRFYSWLGS